MIEVIRDTRFIELSNSQWPLWVGSRPSQQYQLKVRYRAQTGRSATTFQKSKSERLLFPEAGVQTARNRGKLGAAFGHKRTFIRQDKARLTK
jgi:hypothetical protein